MKEQAFISTVIAVYGNEDFFSQDIILINDYLNNHFFNYEIIVIDNESKIINDVKEKIFTNTSENNFSFISLSGEHSHDEAMKAGIDFTIGDYVFELDVIEIPFDIENILKLYNKCNEGYDIVSLVPSNLLKKTSIVFYSIFNKFNGSQISLTSESARIITRRAINEASKFKNKFYYRKFIYYSIGFEKEIIYYDPIRRIRSSIENSNRLNIALDILFSYTNIGSKIGILFANIFAFITIVIGIYALTLYFSTFKVIEGWTTTVLLISFGLTGVFILLSIIARFLGNIMREVIDRPIYKVKKIER